jgi:hypothetical protein
MRWLRRFALAAGISAVLAALLSLVVEPGLGLVVGLAGAATGAVMAFGRRIDAPPGPEDTALPDAPTAEGVSPPGDTARRNPRG